MTPNKSIVPVSIAAVIGIALWLFAAAAAGRREPWDASSYWTVFYPLALMISSFLGYFYPERPWRWVMVLFVAQFVAMCFRSGELGGLWPLGLVMFAVLALPGVLAANLVARLRKRAA